MHNAMSLSPPAHACTQTYETALFDSYKIHCHVITLEVIMLVHDTIPYQNYKVATTLQSTVLSTPHLVTYLSGSCHNLATTKHIVSSLSFCDFHS